MTSSRVAIITGGGRGLGRVIARRLARDGFDLVLADLEHAELDPAAAEIEAAGRRCQAVRADVRDEDQVRELAGRTLRDFGRIDVLVNNAAVVGPTAPVQEVERRDWDDVLAVNLTGPFLCARAVLPGMLERRAGKIVNVASVAGKIAYALRGPYAVSKWGLIGLTLTLAKEAGPFNVQVNAVCPGPVEGPRMDRVIRERAARLGQSEAEARAFYTASTALGRLVRPDDVAELVAFLASPAGDNITGQALDVTAGVGGFEGGTKVDTEERKERGRQLLQQMLGAEQAERVRDVWQGVSPDFENYVLEFLAGEIWSRPQLDLRTRSLVTIAALTALGRPLGLELNIRMALNNGATRQEVVETLLQMGPYAGFPACWEGLTAARKVFRELDGQANE